MGQQECKTKLGWSLSKNQILFAANPNGYVKKYFICKKSF